MKIQKPIKEYRKGVAVNYSATVEVSETDKKLTNALIVASFPVAFVGFIALAIGANLIGAILLAVAFGGLVLMLIIMIIKYLVLKKGDNPIYYSKTNIVHKGTESEYHTVHGVIDPKTGQKMIIDDKENTPH